METRAYSWRMGLALALACATAFHVEFALAEAAAPSVRVAQVVTLGASVTAYLDIRDSDGRAIDGITADQLGATIGAHAAKVQELVPVADTAEGVAFIFLVDVSKSLTNAQFALVKSALEEWVGGLRPVDRGALITFGKGVRLVQDFTADVAPLKAEIAKLAATDLQTFFHQGLVSALTLGQRLDPGLPERRAIVTLTDGIDDVAGGVTADEVYAQLRESRIPLYAIGFASGRDRVKRDAGLNALGQFARRSGGSFRDATGGDLSLAYRSLRQQIAEQYRARLSCEECVADGALYRLQLVLHHAEATVSTDLDVRLLASRAVSEAEGGGAKSESTEEATDTVAKGTEKDAEKADVSVSSGEKEATAPTPPASAFASFPLWVWAAAGGGLLLLALLLALLMHHRRADALAAAEKTAEEARAAAEAARAEQEERAPAPLPPTVASPPRAPPPLTGPALHLAVVSGQRKGERIKLILDGPKTIGRAAGCDLVLDTDPEVSQRHCRFRIAEPHLVIEDLGSTNGTRVNGVPIEAAYALADGDLLGIGRTELRVGWTRSPQ